MKLRSGRRVYNSRTDNCGGVIKQLSKRAVSRAQLAHLRRVYLREPRSPLELYSLLDQLLGNMVTEPDTAYVLSADVAAPMCGALAARHDADRPYAWCQTLCCYVGDYWNLAHHHERGVHHTCVCYLQGDTREPPASVEQWQARLRLHHDFVRGQFGGFQRRY